MNDHSGDRTGPALSPAELERYSRQIPLPEIGEGGQARLKSARVCVVGLGGLGSVSATYLAAAGIGYLRAVDRDCVEPSNLNRQILHWTPDLERSKAESAREKLSRLNPEVEIETLRLEVTPETVEEAVGDCRLIVDATDNLPTRRVLNRFAVARGIPLVLGGVEGFGGMVLTVAPGDSPCLECLFPGEERGKDRLIAVPGPLPGVVASLQTLEALKLVLGAGSSLLGRLLLFRGLDMTFREVRVDRNPECPVCGQARREP
jgi:adenylyltransferase/sulfurtransferase